MHTFSLFGENSAYINCVGCCGDGTPVDAKIFKISELYDGI